MKNSIRFLKFNKLFNLYALRAQIIYIELAKFNVFWNSLYVLKWLKNILSVQGFLRRWFGNCILYRIEKADIWMLVGFISIYTVSKDIYLVSTFFKQCTGGIYHIYTHGSNLWSLLGTWCLNINFHFNIYAQSTKFKYFFIYI